VARIVEIVTTLTRILFIHWATIQGITVGAVLARNSGILQYQLQLLQATFRSVASSSSGTGDFLPSAAPELSRALVPQSASSDRSSE